MGNPLACSIACKSIELLLKSPWQERVLNIESLLKKGLEKCIDYEDVKDVRVLGAIGVVELKSFVNQEKCMEFFVKKGVWIRPFKNLIYIMPPFIISESDLNKLIGSIISIINEKAYV